MGKHVAVYARSGGRPGDAEDQERALRRWVDAGLPLPTRWYRDGTAAEDGTWPSLVRLLWAVREGAVYMLAVWRLDRLGSTAGALAEVFTPLGERGVKLVSLVEGISWTPADVASLAKGLAAVDMSERERRIARLAEGQARARANGRPVGRRHAVADSQCAEVKRLVAEGMTRTRIAQLLHVSRGSVRAAMIRAEAAEVATGPAA